MTEARQQLGRAAEDVVGADLERRGMRVLARNARPAGVRGELDLVALDGDALVFVEVKARTTGSAAGPERPALAVGPVKQRRLRALAAAWVAERPADLPWFAAIRFDVVGLRVAADGRITEWEHLRDAF